jgi:hypothetical protein
VVYAVGGTQLRVGEYHEGYIHLISKNFKNLTTRFSKNIDNYLQSTAMGRHGVEARRSF